ncbi:MAG: shikimate kinase [Flavobacteriia bacterium]|jgi:shikimate kinase|nr:shikimate kinase [Cryomorphaceae bacterium]
MKNIILVGYMGSGKTEVGKILAKHWDLRFINMDSEIELQTGMTVGQLFEQFGEDYFRNLEQDYLRTFTCKEPFVLSTGGGTPCYNNQMDVLKNLGTTIYLQCSNETLFSRLKNEREHRPLIAGLSDEELRESIEFRMKQREPIYQLAHCTIKENSKPEEIIFHHLLRRN